MSSSDPVTESLRAAAKDAERSPLVFSLEDVLAEGTTRRRRHDSRRHRVGFVAMAAAILLVFFVPLPHVSLFGHLVTSGRTSAASSEGRSMTPPIAHGPWPTDVLTRVNLSPNGTVVVSDPKSSEPVILGFEINGSMEPVSEPIVRLDPRTGSFKVGPVVSAESFLERVGDRVVVFTPHRTSLMGTVSGGWSLRAVDVSTLQLGPPLELPFLGNSSGFEATAGIHGADEVWIDDYWVDRGLSLLLLDTVTGKLVREVHAGGADSLELSPDGRILYELGPGPSSGNGRDQVTELDALTGRVLATRRQAFSSGGTAGVSPVGRGVWVTSYQSSVGLLSSDDLRPVALPPGALPPDPPTPETDIWRGYSSYDPGPFVLLQSYRGMTCVAPNTGALRATALWTENRAPRWTAVAVVDRSLVAVESTSFSSSKVLAVHIPAACFA